MICLDVTVNGTRRCRAGAGEHEVLNAVVGFVSRSPEHVARLEAREGATGPVDPRTLTLIVGGRQMDTERQGFWAAENLAVGDLVELCLVEAGDPDPPLDGLPDEVTGFPAGTALALDVDVDGRRLCRAGVGVHGSLSAIVTCVVRSPRNLAELSLRYGVDEPIDPLELELDVLGTGADGGEVLRWAGEALALGQVVAVRVVEAADPDPPLPTSEPT